MKEEIKAYLYSGVIRHDGESNGNVMKGKCGGGEESWTVPGQTRLIKADMNCDVRPLFLLISSGQWKKDSEAGQTEADRRRRHRRAR